MRRGPSDTAEWQFALKKAVAWTEEEMKHGFKGESSAKAEVAMDGAEGPRPFQG